MDDYISREAAIAEIKADAGCANCCVKMSCRCLTCTAGRKIRRVEEIRPADVRPVVRGEWIRRCDSIFAVCPNCGCEVTQIKASVFRDGKGRIDFCPNCGADMRPDGGSDNG